jgi:hypothetical protein
MAAMRGRRHHSRGSVTISTTSVVVVVTAHIVRRTGADSREGASEAGSSTLEVGETARRTGPITRSRAVLAGRERSQDVLSTVENAAGRGRDLNGLLIKGTAIHTKTLSSLLVGRKHSKSSTSRLVLLRSSKSPECNGAATELGEPAFKFGLSSIMRET